MIQHFKRPVGHAPGICHAARTAQRRAVEFAGRVPAEAQSRNATALDNAPEFATQGALVYQPNQCGTCHQVNGVGMKVGSSPERPVQAADPSWVEEHFADPQKLVSGIRMPPYPLSPKDLDNLTTYLMSLPE